MKMIKTNSSVPFYIHKNNWNNNDIFPDVMLIDTCAIRDIFEQRDHGEITQSYLVELNKRNGMIVWTNNIVDELIDFLTVDEYKKLAISKGYGKQNFKKAEYNATTRECKEIGESIYSRLDEIQTYLGNYGLLGENNREDVAVLGRHLQQQYGGNRKDAYHVADALLLGVNSVLTQDGGFLNYPNLNIYGSSKKISNNYNPNRGKLDFIDLYDLTGLPQFKSSSNSSVLLDNDCQEDDAG